jgi:hypothetical protein
MKHKTWFRLVLRLMGVYFVVQSIQGAAYAAGEFLTVLVNTGSIGLTWGWALGGVIGSASWLAIGLYFFFGGEWIVNKAIPSNRPYCPDCGYDLSRATTDRCPECGVVTPGAGARPSTAP